MCQIAVYLDDEKIINSILVGVCDKCDNVITIPHQSVNQIKKEIDRL